MTPLTRTEALELLPAYALGALETKDVEAVEHALTVYPDLWSELRVQSELLAAIASGGEMKPPAALRSRFLDAIAEVPQGASAAKHADEKREDISRRRSARNRSRELALPGLLALALAASLLTLIRTRNEMTSLRDELARRNDTIAAANARAAEQEAMLSTLLGNDPRLLVVDLETPSAAGPGVRFFWNVAARRGLLHAYRLSPAPTGRVYQLWLIRDGKPVPSRVFNSDANGRSVVASIELPESLVGVSAVAITEEPKGGSVLPTTQPFLVGNLPKTD